MPFLLAVYHWFAAHQSVLVPLALLLLPSLITGLSTHPEPWTAPLVAALQFIFDRLSLVTHANSPGTFKLPLTGSQPEASSPQRGYLSLRSAAVLLVACSLILGVAGCAAMHKLFGPSIGQDEIDCGETAVKDFAKKMAPDASACLTSLGDWSGCLAKVEADAALAGGEVAVSGIVCSVAVLVRDFELARSAPAAACASADRSCAPSPNIAPLAAMRGRSYLAAHKHTVFPQ